MTVRAVSSAPSMAAVTPAATGSRVRMIAARDAEIRDCDQLNNTIAAAVAKTARKPRLSQVWRSVGTEGQGRSPVNADPMTPTPTAIAATVAV